MTKVACSLFLLGILAVSQQSSAYTLSFTDGDVPVLDERQLPDELVSTRAIALVRNVVEQSPDELVPERVAEAWHAYLPLARLDRDPTLMGLSSYTREVRYVRVPLVVRMLENGYPFTYVVGTCTMDSTTYVGVDLTCSPRFELYIDILAPREKPTEEVMRIGIDLLTTTASMLTEDGWYPLDSGTATRIIAGVRNLVGH